MATVSELTSKNIAETQANVRNWGRLVYNVREYGLVGDGVTDDTVKLQALIDLAILDGRKTIAFNSGVYYVTALTNADQVFFVGDNASFTGGYAGHIEQLGEMGVTQSEFDALKFVKADKTYVDTQVSAVASGAPNGVYATLVALDTAIPAGDSNIYLVTADGNWYYWNGSAWTAGGVYQSTGLAFNSISKEHLTFTPVTGTPGKNLFDKDAAVAGYYVSYLDGTLKTNASYYASDWIPVDPSTVYTRPADHFQQTAFYDTNKVFISGVDGAGNESWTTPANCYYVRISIPSTAFLLTEQLELGDTPTTYQTYGSKLSYNDLIDTPPTTTTVTVGTGKDYSTIAAAIAAVTGTVDSPVDIKIYAGTYVEGNLPLKDYVNIVGVDRDSVVIDFPGTSGDEINQDVFRGAAKCTIKNLTAKGEYVKYVLHADEGGDCEIVLEQVKFEKIGTAANYAAAVGLGLRGDQKFKVKNSELIGTVSSSLGALYCHNWNDQIGNAILEIENSYLHGANTGAYIGSLGSGMTDLLILRGNKFDGAIADIAFYRDTNFGHNQDDWNVIAEGNEIDQIGHKLGATTTFTQPAVTAIPSTVVL